MWLTSVTRSTPVIFNCDHQHVFHKERPVFFFFFFFFIKLIYKGIIKSLLELFLYLRAFGKILTIFYNLKGHCQLNDCFISKCQVA
jgi:hypothetical protein